MSKNLGCDHGMRPRGSWAFADEPHTGAYTRKAVFEKREPILLITHDDDGSWQFHGPGEADVEQGVLVCLHHMVDMDPSVNELADLPLGWVAWRESVSDPWTREPHW